MHWSFKSNFLYLVTIPFYLHSKLAKVPGVARGILKNRIFEKKSVSTMYPTVYPWVSSKNLNSVHPYFWPVATANIYIIYMSEELYNIDKDRLNNILWQNCVATYMTPAGKVNGILMVNLKDFAMEKKSTLIIL